MALQPKYIEYSVPERSGKRAHNVLIVLDLQATCRSSCEDKVGTQSSRQAHCGLRPSGTAGRCSAPPPRSPPAQRYPLRFELTVRTGPTAARYGAEPACAQNRSRARALDGARCTATRVTRKVGAPFASARSPMSPRRRESCGCHDADMSSARAASSVGGSSLRRRAALLAVECMAAYGIATE
jgi:hypothetical protein